jgi:hypothetical protein
VINSPFKIIILPELINTKLAIITFVIAIALTQTVGAVSIIPVPQEKWTCYDWSVDFARENPEWGIVTISDNQWFNSNIGVSHMVNYQKVNNETLLIHDGLYGTDYIVAGWQLQGYYHFWINETPVRNYVVMQDNRNIIK